MLANSIASVLVIAGSDSSAGAGIQADIKALSSINCYASSVITAITAQNTKGVQKVSLLEAELVRAQIEAVLSDIKTDVVKLGMLGNHAIVSTINKVLSSHPKLRIVLDPVILSTSGTTLLDDLGLEILKKEILPKTFLITPNLPETVKLLGLKDEEECIGLLKIGKLPVFGAKYWLIKGGHMSGENCSDYLLDSNGNVLKAFSSERIKISNVHGTGCTLASLIAGNLAKSHSIEVAIKNAKKSLFYLMKNSVSIGSGSRVLNYDFYQASLDISSRFKS